VNSPLDALNRHARSINERNLGQYTETMIFPFTYQNYNGVALTIENPEDCGTIAPAPWEIILETDPNWSHTVFDAIEEIARSKMSAAFKVTFRRISKENIASKPYQAIWIAACKEKKWGIQFRHNLGIISCS